MVAEVDSNFCHNVIARRIRRPLACGTWMKVSVKSPFPVRVIFELHMLVLNDETDFYFVKFATLLLDFIAR